MDESSFGKGFDNLAKNFGLKMGGDQYQNKSELFWDEFKNVPNNIWEKGMKQILETEERFPTIARIKSVLQEVSRGFYFEDEIPKVNCDKCEGTGYASTVKPYGEWGDSNSENKILWAEYVFRCTCEAGAYREKGIPIWEDKWRNKGHLPRVEWEKWWEENELGRHPNPIDVDFIQQLEGIKKKILVNQESWN